MGIGTALGECSRAKMQNRIEEKMSERQKLQTVTIRLIGEEQRQVAHLRLAHLPVDPDKPIEIIFREEKKTRSLDANALMWAGTLKDISEQAWLDRRQYSDEVWHHYFKEKYLPEDNDPDMESMTKDGYRKWDFDPDGCKVLVGSTKQLTRKGFAIYLEQVMAFGASLGVMFHEAPEKYK
jgi:hypothetical protein